MSQLDEYRSEPYRVIAGCDTRDLSERVHELIKEGFVLYGSLNMSVDGQGKRHYSQVLVAPNVKRADYQVYVSSNKEFISF
jgi:hypothetical protein